MHDTWPIFTVQNLPIVLTYKTTFAGLDEKESTALNYALQEELVLTPVDYLLRRTNHVLFMRDYVGSDQSWCDRCNGGLF